ncbi:MAG: hypothetical protein IPJ41_17880 [Phycisphaerales bacterium]|nr:hypothetical protein [Phycisphaerales bacterium]
MSVLQRTCRLIGVERRGWLLLASLVPLFLVLGAYLLIQSVMTQDIGIGIYRVADNALYADTIRRLQLGLTHFDLRYAFSGSNYAYSSLYFLVLAGASFPAGVLGIEPLFLYSMHLVNPALFVGSMAVLFAVMRRVWPEAWEGAGAWFWPIALALCLSMRTLHMMFVHLHPELLQAFLLFAVVWALSRHHAKPGYVWSIAAGLIFGLMVAAKISSVIFLVGPGAYFAWRSLHDRRFVVNAAEFSVLGIVAGIVALLLVDALAWADTSTGFSRFFSEYKFFSQTLGVSAIAEYDKSAALGSRGRVALAWLSEPYNHGLLPIVAYYPLLLATAWWAVRYEARRSERFPLASIAVCLHAVACAFYLAMVTRVTSYYLLPTMLLLVPVGLRCVWGLCSRSVAARAVVAASAVACVVLGLVGIGGYLRTDLLDRERDFAAMRSALGPVERLIRERPDPTGLGDVRPAAPAPVGHGRNRVLTRGQGRPQVHPLCGAPPCGLFSGRGLQGAAPAGHRHSVEGLAPGARTYDRRTRGRGHATDL